MHTDLNFSNFASRICCSFMSRPSTLREVVAGSNSATARKVSAESAVGTTDIRLRAGTATSTRRIEADVDAGTAVVKTAGRALPSSFPTPPSFPVTATGADGTTDEATGPSVVTTTADPATALTGGGKVTEDSDRMGIDAGCGTVAADGSASGFVPALVPATGLCETTPADGSRGGSALLDTPWTSTTAIRHKCGGCGRLRREAAVAACSTPQRVGAVKA